VGLGNIFLRAAADVFAIGFGAHEGIVHFSQRLRRGQLFFQRWLVRESMAGPTQRLPPLD
jgi:hypothetical protein